MKEFIRSNELVFIKFYGIQFRLSVVFVDDEPSVWIVDKRTANKRDQVTFTFLDRDSAVDKLRHLINSSHIGLGDVITEKL